MALSAQEEEVIKQIIEAFQNGKRLSDLPNVSGTNPYNLFVEVLDEDGESKKAALASLLPYVEEDCSYGIEFDTSVSSPSCTRVGNLAMHKSVPIQSRMRGCLLDDSGKVVEYLDPRDWTGQVRDGSRGQVMVEIPMHYRKCETNGTKRTVRISELPLPGYTQVPLIYVSAYEAAIERSTGKLCSVANMGTDYRGGNNNTEYDGTYRTFLGRPVTAMSRTAFRTAARKRNTSSKAWNCYVYQAHKTLFWLFAIEYATLNSQAAYNSELTAEGYHQGGLGAGVTTWDGTWSNFNGYYPFVPCGHTDTLGNQTGTVSYTAAMMTQQSQRLLMFLVTGALKIRLVIYGNGQTLSMSVSAQPLITAGTTSQKCSSVMTLRSSTTRTMRVTAMSEMKPERRVMSKR